MNGQNYGLDNDKILLRGCTLRNTEWCFGLVIFGGKHFSVALYKRRDSWEIIDEGTSTNRHVAPINTSACPTMYCQKSSGQNSLVSQLAEGRVLSLVA